MSEAVVSEGEFGGADQDAISVARGGGDLAASPKLVDMLLAGLASTQDGICLCDENDQVRYANAAFRSAFFGDLTTTGEVNFADALAQAIRVGRGINLESAPLEDFVALVKDRRRTTRRRRFTVDLVDGSWWRVNDDKLANGWLLVIASDISSVKDEEFRLRTAHASAIKVAQTDFLTGLANRRHGFEQAELALTGFRHNGLDLSLAILDIDHFKRVNDRFGHDVGDKALIHVARFLVQGIHGRDQISRIGGEEFLLVMPEAPVERARCRLEQLLHDIPPLDIGYDRPPLDLTVSAGVTSARPPDTLTDLLHRADLALYDAKSGGRNRVG